MGLFCVFPLYKLRSVPYDCNDLTIQRWMTGCVAMHVGGVKPQDSKREEEV
jgi:hypothetical protein